MPAENMFIDQTPTRNANWNTHTELPKLAERQWLAVKGGFFPESAMCFLNLPISKIKIFQKAILNLKFKFPANNSKQQIQISSSR